MDNENDLYQFWQASGPSFFTPVVFTSPTDIQYYELIRQDESGLDDYMILRSINWGNRYILHNERGIGRIPHVENSKLYTILIMPENMLYLAGMDMKLSRIREETKGKIKVEPMRHLLLSLPDKTDPGTGSDFPNTTVGLPQPGLANTSVGLAGTNLNLSNTSVGLPQPGLTNTSVGLTGTSPSQVQTYVRLIQSKQLSCLTPELLLRLQENRTLPQEQIHTSIDDLVNLMLYLWSQGIQGLRNAIFLDDKLQLTFIPFNLTRYAHYGVNANPDDLVILSSFARQEFNLPSQTIETLTRKDWGDTLPRLDDHKEGLQEFELPDVELPAQQHQRYHEFFTYGTANISSTIGQELAEMLATLVSLGLQDQLRFNLSELARDENKARTMVKDEMLRVYMKNLYLTKYLRPPTYHFYPPGINSIKIHLGKFPTRDYQQVRNEWRNDDILSIKMPLPVGFRSRYLRLFPSMFTEDTARWQSRRFSSDSFKTFVEVSDKIYNEEVKKLDYPKNRSTFESKVLVENYTRRQVAETYVGRILQSIRDFISYPQVPLYLLDVSHRKTMINGIQFSAYDLTRVFFDTPLASESTEITLSGFSYKDLKIIRDYLMGRKPIMSLYRGLSVNAYNQLSSYGSLLSAFEIREVRWILCRNFILGLPVVEQIRRNKIPILTFLNDQGYEYLVQRIEII